MVKGDWHDVCSPSKWDDISNLLKSLPSNSTVYNALITFSMPRYRCPFYTTASALAIVDLCGCLHKYFWIHFEVSRMEYVIAKFLNVLKLMTELSFNLLYVH